MKSGSEDLQTKSKSLSETYEGRGFTERIRVRFTLENKENLKDN